MSSYFRRVESLPTEELPPGKGLPGLVIRSLLGPDETDRFSARVVTFPPGATSPPTYHRVAREVVYVLEGEAEFEVAGQRKVCSAGSVIHVPPGAVHVIRSLASGVRFLAVESPAVTLDGDIVFVEPDGTEKQYTKGAARK